MSTVTGWPLKSPPSTGLVGVMMSVASAVKVTTMLSVSVPTVFLSTVKVTLFSRQLWRVSGVNWRPRSPRSRVVKAPT